MASELFLQLLIVFDNAVVHRYHSTAHSHMRMRIVLGGLTMGCPACMADTAASLDSISPLCLLRKVLQPPHGLHHLNGLTAIPHCNACRVITTILQLGKAIQKNGGRLLLTNKSYNSAHKKNSSLTKQA